MRYAVISGGKVSNVVTSNQKLEDNWVASDTAQIGDTWDGKAFTTTQVAPKVPDRVTRRQAKEALIRAGLIEKVQGVIDATKDPLERAIAQNWWDEAPDFERAHPLLNQLASAMGLSADQLDTLFTQAASL
jgi:hypothetical protein